MKLTTWMAAAALAALTTAATAAAEEWPRVEARSSGEIRYVNGGFGLEERAAMPAGYPLKLVFATEKGHLLSVVRVVLTDAAGAKVLEIDANDGPWLLLKLKPGRYSLEATHNGSRKTLSGIEVPVKGTRTEVIRWKIAEVDMGLPD